MKFEDSKKVDIFQNIPSWLWPSFFQNLNFFHFSWHIIGLVCRTVTIFLPMQRARLSGPPRYLERCRKAYRKFSRGTWKKKFQLKIWGFVSIFQTPFELHFSLMFWVETFFQNSLENFLWTLWTCSSYRKGPSNLYLCVNKKVVTVGHTNQIIY